MKKLLMRLALLGILLLFVVPAMPTTAAKPAIETGTDQIWVAEGPWQYGSGLIHIKLGYTHWDYSSMQINIETPVLSGGSGYVLVLTNASWTPGRNYPNCGYITYNFCPSVSSQYWADHGKLVNPSYALRFEMISTTSGTQIIDDVPWPYGQ